MVHFVCVQVCIYISSLLVICETSQTYATCTGLGALLLRAGPFVHACTVIFVFRTYFATTCTLYMYIVGQRNIIIVSVRVGFSNCVSVKLGSGCRVYVLRYVVVAMS